MHIIISLGLHKEGPLWWVVSPSLVLNRPFLSKKKKRLSAHKKNRATHQKLGMSTVGFNNGITWNAIPRASVTPVRPFLVTRETRPVRWRRGATALPKVAFRSPEPKSSIAMVDYWSVAMFNGVINGYMLFTKPTSFCLVKWERDLIRLFCGSWITLPGFPF